MVLVVVLVSACGGSDAPSPSAAPTTSATAAASPLRAACGERIAVQTDWFPEPEHAALYQLIGSGRLDKETGRYSGEITGTGVTLEVRSGGPFLAGQPTISILYQDDNVLLAYMNTDAQVANSAERPTVAVVTPLERFPMMLMWDPARYQFSTIADIGTSDARVLYFEGVTYIHYLVGKGLLRPDQIDGSYDGSPARFVAEGNIVQQGFVTHEPYKYEHDIAPWKKPVSHLLVADAGYEIYAQALAVKPSTLTGKRECLKLLVPLIQQAQVDYIKNPKPVNDELLRIVKELATFWTLSAGGNEYAVKTMLDKGIVGNGPDQTLGNFDMARVQRMVDEVTPVLKGRNIAVKDGIKAEDLATNEFIDPSIGLSS